ncbi:hypothetical protein ACTXT7_004402 [Hymenolepis weldensis]
MTPYADDQTRVDRTSHSRYAALTSKPKTNPTEIYLDACHLPLPRNTEIPMTQRNYQPDRFSGRFRRPRKRFKVDSTLKRMERQLSPRIIE